MNVAVLGTGRMGSAMARALRTKAFDLVLWNRTPGTARVLGGELGAEVASSPSAAVTGADVAITMLADREAVEDTFRGPDGVLAGVHHGLVLVEMSTVEPEVSEALAPDVRALGGELLDAPVSGSVTLAERGALTVMVGGDEAALERARPVLDALAGRVFHLGPTGTGAAMKLAVNTVIYALDVGLSEGLVLAERAGIDRSKAYDVLEASAVGAPFVGYKRAAFLDPESTPPAFSAELAAKDLDLIDRLSARLTLPLRQAAINREVIGRLVRTGCGDRDFSWVAEALRAATEPVVMNTEADAGRRLGYPAESGRNGDAAQENAAHEKGVRR